MLNLEFAQTEYRCPAAAPTIPVSDTGSRTRLSSKRWKAHQTDNRSWKPIRLISIALQFLGPIQAHVKGTRKPNSWSGGR